MLINGLDYKNPKSLYISPSSLIHEKREKKETQNKSQKNFS